MRWNPSKMPTKQGFNPTDSRWVFGQPSGRRRHPVRAGLYARVSTHDQQTLSLQRRALRDYLFGEVGRLSSRLVDYRRG